MNEELKLCENGKKSQGGGVRWGGQCGLKLL